MRSELVERYSRLLDRHPSLREALCWTVIEPVTAPVDPPEVARRLGGQPGDLTLRHPRTPDIDVDHDRQCRYFLDEVGTAVAMLEFAGQGSRPEVLRRLSDGARVHSACWGVDGANRLSYAVYGGVVTSLSADLSEARGGSDPDALDADLDVLLAAAPSGDAGRAADGDGAGRDRTGRGGARDAGRVGDSRGAGGGDWQAAMLAVIEARTGIPLEDDWPVRPHPAVVLPRVPADPRPPNSWVEPDLDAHLRLAAEPVRRAALGWLLELVATAFQLTDEPALVRGIAALRAGEAVDEEDRRAGDAVRDRLAADAAPVSAAPRPADDPRWRRAQAGRALATALGPPAGDAHFAALWHARLSLGESWPRVRAELRSRLRSGR